MQGELLYRRYLNKGDIFVHADLQGALPIVVKNRPGYADAPIPPSTLSQAGNLCVACSTAWDSKAVMSAWWAYPIQVSKIAEVGGGILPTGDFQIKGEKNFLAPSQLVLGFAVLFQISQESIKNHKQRFDTEEALAGADVGQPKAESPVEQPPLEQTEASPAVDEPGEQEQEGNESGEEEEEEEDRRPARNPLQRGESELPTSQEPHAQFSDAESEDEDEEQNGQRHVGETGSAQDEGIAEALDQENELQDEEAASTTDVATSEHQQEEQKLSARERRTLRQGKSLDRQDQAEPASRIPPTRGKKAKEKRAAAKYAHQDEEERELALRLLGANKGKAAKAAQAAEAKAQREREAEAQRQRRRAQHERAAEAERKRQAQFAEDGADDYNEETAAAEAADLSWIPALVGTPSPGDEILAAIAVCAPWASLGRYKYKMKLQPGTVKKGKAVKEIVGRWVSETTTGKVKKDHAEDLGISRVDAEDLRAREGELIKAWKDTEIINTMPVGKVRIMTPGGAGGGGDKGKGKGGGGKGGGRGGRGGKKK